MRTLPLILLPLVLLAGCTNPVYQAVPECASGTPPKGDQWVRATPDEKLVLMTTAYIRQTQVVTDCNADIRVINAANKAADK